MHLMKSHHKVITEIISKLIAICWVFLQGFLLRMSSGVNAVKKSLFLVMNTLEMITHWRYQCPQPLTAATAG